MVVLSFVKVHTVCRRMCPIFQVSNVTGENLNLLRMFLNLLSTRMPCDYMAPAEFQIDETFAVPVCSFHAAEGSVRCPLYQLSLVSTILLPFRRCHFRTPLPLPYALARWRR